jgi:hypothetical protein
LAINEILNELKHRCCGGALDVYLPEYHQGSYGDGYKRGDGAGRGNGGFEPVHPSVKENV